MKKIPSDFVYTKYGLTARLVREEDAAFILKLRTNEKLSKYLHKTENDLDKQVAWIREYKKREAKGEDYYFIYFSGERPVGLNRISNITENSAVGGSWICSKDATLEEAIATNFLNSDIWGIFELPIGPFNVSKGNNQVLKYHLRMGAEIIDENDNEYTLMTNVEKYLKAKNKYAKLLGLI